MSRMQANPEVVYATNNIYEALKTKEYGTQFTWDDLAKFSKLTNPPKPLLYYCTNRANKLLMMHDSRFLQNVHGLGKRILNPNEHAVTAKRTAQKSVRMYRKAGQILACTNVDQLTGDEKEQVIRDANRWRTLELFSSEMMKNKQIKTDADMSPENVRQAIDFIEFFKKAKKVED